MSLKYIAKNIDQRVILCVSIMMTSILFNMSIASAASRYWIVPSGDWSTPSNWGGGEPTSSDSALIHNSGTASITLADEVCSSLVLGSPPMTSGSLNITSGSLTTTSAEIVGLYGTGTLTQSGGTNTYNGAVILGFSSGSRGTYNMSGGSLLTNSPNAIIIVGQGSTGTFNQSGGYNAASAIGISSMGTYNFTGGTLVVKSLNPGGYFNFGGGTLQAGTNFSTSRNMTLTGINGNANVDTAGYSVTFSGGLTSQGGLNKVGTGTLTLSRAVFYNGATTINGGGTLKISGGIPTGNTPLIDIINGTALFDTTGINNAGLNIDIDANGILNIGSTGSGYSVGYISGSGWIDLNQDLYCTGYDSGTLHINYNGFHIYTR